MSSKEPDIRAWDSALQYFQNPEFWTGSYVQFAAEIGYVAWAWNTIQADLADLFWLIVNKDDPKVVRAVWNALKSDSAQREMLLAATQEKYAEIDGKQYLLIEIKWLVNEVGKMSAIRNDAFHSLWTIDFALSVQDKMGEMPRKAKPDPRRGSPRSKRLDGFDHKELFSTFCGYAMILVNYSRFLASHVQEWDDGEPLPDRPPRPPLLQSYLDQRKSTPQAQ